LRTVPGKPGGAVDVRSHEPRAELAISSCENKAIGWQVTRFTPQGKLEAIFEQLLQHQS
jgi:hypothetical protein